MKSFRRLPIAVQLWSFGIVIILVISVIFMTSYQMISKSIVDGNIAYTTQFFTQIQSNITERTIFLERLLKSIGYNRVVASYIVETENIQKYDNMAALNSLVVNINDLEGNIKEVVIEGANGSNYFSIGTSEKTAEALATLPKMPNNYYSFSYKLGAYGDEKLSFLLSTSIFDVWNMSFDMNFMGRITFVVNMDMLGMKNTTNEFDMSMFLLNEKYEIYSSNALATEDTDNIISQLKINGQRGRREIIANGTEYIANYDRITPIGGMILSITPKDTIMDDISWIKKVTYYLLLIALLLVLIMFSALKYNITEPLRKFGTFMRQIKDGNVKKLKQGITLQGYKEIEEISQEFNNMLEQVNTLTHRLVSTTTMLYETELQKKQSELSYLKSQINPHFLYNTLEVIMGTSYIEKATKTAGMIKSLSNIFKYSIKGEDMVLVSEELNVIKSYIYIQQTRFIDMFDVFYEFEELVLDKRIPKMVLQPIVENAIAHGLEGKGDRGNVYIGGKVGWKGETQLWVQDDGVGIDEETLGHIRLIIEGKATKRNDSIGIENVINRIKLIYCDRCKIDIKSEVGKGTRFEILIL